MQHFILKVMKQCWLKFKKCFTLKKVEMSNLKDELTAYNPLIPDGKELIATLMFEIDNPISRAAF